MMALKGRKLWHHHGDNDDHCCQEKLHSQNGIDFKDELVSGLRVKLRLCG